MKQRINHEINDFEKASEQMWVEEAEKALKGKSIQSLSRKTYEGITLSPLYTEHNTQSSWENRGTAAQKRNDWSVSQKLQRSKTPEQLNDEIREAMQRGQDIIHLEDIGYLETYQNICTAFEGIDLEQIEFHLSLKGNIGFFPLMITYLKNKDCKGLFAFDPYGEWISESDPVSLKKKIECLAEMIDILDQENLPNVRAVLFSGEIFHNAGGSALEELAFTFSNAIELLNTLKERGFSIGKLADKIGFTFSAGSNFFMEIAKFRAAKKIWATIMTAFGASADLHPLVLHAASSAFNKTKHDLHVNSLRATTEAFSAAIGGVNSLTIAPFDEVLGDVSKTGDRIARNTHYILKEESLLSKVADPAGGSWYIEELTEELAELAWKEIQCIETMGGFVQAARQNYIQEKLRTLLTLRLEDVSKRKVQLIGTNYYANLQEPELEIQKTERKTPIAEAGGTESALSLKEWMKAANTVKASEINAALTGDKSNEKLTHLLSKRLAEQFEGLRADSGRYKSRFGHYPKVEVLVLGKLLDYKPRLDFVTGMLSAGGIEAVILKPDQQEVPDKPIIICGKDEAYGSLDFIKGLQDVIVYAAGRLDKDKLEQHGIHECIYHGMDVYAFLKKLQLQLGVS
ncbi:methylmalonyl-CoA mutase family protein [Metabacillus idriensis]|uniref:methylmalonyl-CoA mutase family protein n=1 Tax=Metabacillus idriensis TaxID=324768 RepID=UPI003D2E2192